MEEKPAYQKDIESIRQLMERSAKFISLSGLSGIMAGTYALLGAAGAYYLIDHHPAADLIWRLAILAIGVLIASLATGYWLSARKSKKIGARIWDATSKRLLINLGIPLLSGGAFILILLLKGYFGLIAPSCLVFYGLALINASPGVYEEVRYLGYLEILLGLISAWVMGHALVFWSVGFGILHIIYGAFMYKKYDA